MGQGIGQPIGGLLSHPQRHLSLFDSLFWRRHPFALPGLLSGSITLVLVVFGYCLLDEVRIFLFLDNSFYGDNLSDSPFKEKKGVKRAYVRGDRYY